MTLPPSGDVRTEIARRIGPFTSMGGAARCATRAMKTREPDTYRLDTPAVALADPAGLRRLAADVLPRVARTDFTAPGFALVRVADDLTSGQFRAALTDFAAALGDAYHSHFGRRLVAYWMGRFSQQATTEPHLDGAPDESVLVLGYEPSEVASRLFVYDYARAAADRGMGPKVFMDRLNPTFGEGKAAIAPYRTAVEGFDPGRYNVLVLNNSSAPPDQAAAAGMLGVLHQSVVPAPRPGAERFINTLMLRTADPAAPGGGCGREAVRAFVDAGEFQSCGE